LQRLKRAVRKAKQQGPEKAGAEGYELPGQTPACFLPGAQLESRASLEINDCFQFVKTA
jgi:hypothetical protein